MNHRIIKVFTYLNYQLLLQFSNKEWRIFDVKPYLDKGIFIQLRDLSVFNSVSVIDDSIQWCNEADFCPDCLYAESTIANKEQMAYINEKLQNKRDKKEIQPI